MVVDPPPPVPPHVANAVLKLDDDLPVEAGGAIPTQPTTKPQPLVVEPAEGIIWTKLVTKVSTTFELIARSPHVKPCKFTFNPLAPGNVMGTRHAFV